MSGAASADELQALRELLREDPAELIRRHEGVARDLARQAREEGKDHVANEIERVIEEVTA